MVLASSALLLVTPAAAQAAESVRGTLQDGEREPVVGTAIEVADPDGNVIGTVETDDAGAWQVDLPGPGDYVVTLDDSTLPDGVALRDAENNPLEVNVRAGQNRSVIFALGEGAAGGDWLPELLQRTLTGLRFGLIIAITAIGLSLIFGTTGLVNFAHGELVTFGAVIAWVFNNPGNLGLQLLGAAAIAVAATALLGGGIELGIFRPLRARRTGLVQMLVISIGLALVLRFGLAFFFGGNRRPYFDYQLQQAWTLGPLRITPRDLTVMLLAGIVLVLVATMLQRTRIGKAMRAVSDNRDLAESSGIDVRRVILFVWIIGGALAGFGGVLYGLAENVQYLMGFRLLLLMFAGVILGGLGTAYGAMVGSLVIGLVTELSTLWFPTDLKFVWALLALILILLVRPQGLLGRAERIG
ncbi:branched-chain amino acid ABC transporter permease [Nitriliruptoraceae bacterium ZYF776]|nr:branched-chain amino acid ABC transporter permease [Profundirhabdus halotolerans]